MSSLTNYFLTHSPRQILPNIDQTYECGTKGPSSTWTGHRRIDDIIYYDNIDQTYELNVLNEELKMITS